MYFLHLTLRKPAAHSWKQMKHLDFKEDSFVAHAIKHGRKIMCIYLDEIVPKNVDLLWLSTTSAPPLRLLSGCPGHYTHVRCAEQTFFTLECCMLDCKWAGLPPFTPGSHKVQLQNTNNWKKFSLGNVGHCVKINGGPNFSFLLCLQLRWYLRKLPHVLFLGPFCLLCEAHYRKDIMNIFTYYH